MPSILVIGAGVIGLSTAIALLKQNYKVTIFAEQISPNTCSDIAPAIWEPFLCEPKELVFKWANESLHYFRKLANESPYLSHGVRIASGYQVFNNLENVIIPDWADEEDLKDHKYLSNKNFKYALKYQIPIIDMSLYMTYLLKTFLNMEGKLYIKKVTNLESVMDNFDIIINCAGLGAGELVNDNLVFPACGQLIEVYAPYLDEFIMHEEFDATGDLTYIIPRANSVILGGTKKATKNKLIDVKQSKAILERCCKYVPNLEKAPILKQTVGLRPRRAEVRLEKQILNGKLVIHNYGHGGSGVTLSIGCANEITKMVKTYQKIKSKL